jgi:hypothetical protein
MRGWTNSKRNRQEVNNFILNNTQNTIMKSETVRKRGGALPRIAVEN